ncbi:hypothetical protein [Nannocystis pusilla]|uniref:hypothetical protein n=1 Tax=Nannocystis pusilla TaxID=889268 RepID=UPI003B7EE8BD
MAAAMTEVSAGLALGATTQAAQTAVDAVALAARLLMGKDPGTPPCFGAIITGASSVQIGGFPMPPGASRSAPWETRARPQVEDARSEPR